MKNKVGLWHINAGSLKRVEESNVDLEASMEEWIESDPSILQSGLTIVGRQLRVDGGIIDLLAVDPNSRWAVIEIKRGDLRRETVAQALDYASCIEKLSPDELRSKIDPYLKKRGIKPETLKEALEPTDRAVTVFIVGTGKDPGLDRMTGYLEKFGMPVTVVTFDAFRLNEKSQLLAREITEVETAQTRPAQGSPVTNQQVLELAKAGGTREIMERCIAASKELGIESRAWKTSIMFTPAQNRTRALFTVWAQRQGGKVKAWVSNEAFSQFFPVTAKAVQAQVTNEGWKLWSDQELDQFLANLKALLLKSS